LENTTKNGHSVAELDVGWLEEVVHEGLTGLVQLELAWDLLALEHDWEGVTTGVGVVDLADLTGVVG
jgi:hypothetical protein